MIDFAPSRKRVIAIIEDLKAFAGAAHVTKLDLVNNRLVPTAMEPRGAIAAFDPASQRAGVEQAAAALGGIDILVHNAGVAEFASITEDTDETYDRQFAVNVKGLHVGTRAALPHLRNGGRIILIGSISGEMAFPATTVYSATKAAVAALARGWAKDLAPRNILVNTVQPGPIDTDMNPADSDFAAQLLQAIPLGRYGTVEEIAGAVAFLAGPDASYITGTTLNIDGGATA